MPPPHRRPSRSVKVPGRVSRPVRLGHQSTGSLFAPHYERPHTGEEVPHGPRGSVTPSRRAEDAAPEGIHDDDAAQVEAGPEEASVPGPSPAETGPANVTPADARQADGGPADGGPADSGPAGTGPASAGPQARPDRLPRRTPGSSQVAPGSPPRVPARQGPPPQPAPGSTAPAVRPGGAPAARRPAAEPSWGTVLATTIRLWAKRRLEKPWLRALPVLALAVIVFCAGAVTATLMGGNTTSSSATGPGTAAGGSRALAAVASARKQTAAWVARQVNPDEVIGCDPVMCTALEAARIQANRLLVLGPSRPDPLGSEILLDTATLRSQFGDRLETVYAPVRLAAFGSGAARVEVRFVAPDGAKAYLAELARDQAARKAAGTEMLRNRAIHAFPAARRQLTAGRVDTRLLVTLVTLAHNYPVDIIGFGANQAGASPGVPLRSAKIAGAPGPGSTPAASVLTLRRFLRAQQPPYRPSIVAVTPAAGRTVLRVGYPAPSLLGLLGTHG